MKVLITGASGFIGSYLVNYLKQFKQYELILLVRHLPEHFKYWKNIFTVIENDIVDFDQLKEKLPYDIDTIIHLASYNDVDTNKNPLMALNVNAFGTRNILEISKEHGVKHVIYFSVLQVYGREMEGHFTIESPVLCDNDYSLNHYMAEEYCKMYSINYDLSTSIIRLGYAFGCPVDNRVDRWSIVPEVFCMEAFKSNNIIIKSSGRSARDFVPLSYISESVQHLIENQKTGFNIYNLTSEVLIPIIDTAYMVKEIGENVLNNNINIIVQSNEPKKSNKFLAENNLLGALKKNVVLDIMSKELEKIFLSLRNDLI